MLKAVEVKLAWGITYWPSMVEARSLITEVPKHYSKVRINIGGLLVVREVCDQQFTAIDVAPFNSLLPLNMKILID